MHWCRVLFTLGVLAFAPNTSAAAPLSPGPVSMPPGAKLGELVIFENEITSSYCFPLINRRGVELLWLSDLHRFDSRLLVQRCVEYEPSAFVTRGARHGGSREQWEELRFADPESSPTSKELGLPGYGYFSNPGFCGAKVAYWIQEEDRWSVTIYDLAKNRSVVTRFIRPDAAETDNPEHFERPKWNDACTQATVQGTPPIDAR